MNCINYSIIAEAVKAYTALGYQQIEVPWWATGNVINITKPTVANSREDYQISANGKYLLASGEQGFLYLANKGQLPPGKYQTVTPCFRNEPYDETHSKQFMKLELIDLQAESFTSIAQANALVYSMADDAIKTMAVLSRLGSRPLHSTARFNRRSLFVSDPVAYRINDEVSNQVDIELGCLVPVRLSS